MEALSRLAKFTSRLLFFFCWISFLLSVFCFMIFTLCTMSCVVFADDTHSISAAASHTKYDCRLSREQPTETPSLRGDVSRQRESGFALEKRAQPLFNRARGFSRLLNTILETPSYYFHAAIDEPYTHTRANASRHTTHRIRTSLASRTHLPCFACAHIAHAHTPMHGRAHQH